MYRIIIILYSLSIFSCVKCNLDKEEGAACEWEGVKGTCVNSHRCLTTLDDRSPKQPICSQKGEETIICCTDCELVNDTRNAVFSPTSGLYWKTGEKARDKCLDYLKDLPYECHLSYYSSLRRELDEEKKCHRYSLWGVGGPPAIGSEPRNKYPHMVLIGHGDNVERAHWFCGGAIISDKYILTTAICTSALEIHVYKYKYIAYGILNRALPTEQLKLATIRRVINHPEYNPFRQLHDVALIELDTPIIFNKNVLPACLHVDPDAYDDEALFATWRDPARYDSVLTDTPSEVEVKKYGANECSSEYTPNESLVPGMFDNVTQLCYSDKDQPAKACRIFSGEPLLINTQFSWCFYTIIGLSSHHYSCNLNQKYRVFIKVSHYVPWIESIVWP